MRKHIRKSLSNNRGVSLTMALLVFLVCAMVGSVVLAAGSAAAGRLTSVRKHEQDYYSLMCAAEYVRGAIDGQSVGVVSRNSIDMSRTVHIAPVAGGEDKETRTSYGEWSSVSTNAYLFTERLADMSGTNTGLDDLEDMEETALTGSAERRLYVTSDSVENILEDTLACLVVEDYSSQYFPANQNEISYTLSLDAIGVDKAASEVDMRLSKSEDGALSVVLSRNERYIKLVFGVSAYADEAPRLVYPRDDEGESKDGSFAYEDGEIPAEGVTLTQTRKEIYEQNWIYTWKAEDMRRSR